MESSRNYRHVQCTGLLSHAQVCYSRSSGLWVRVIRTNSQLLEAERLTNNHIFSVAVPIYNALLSYYYYLVIVRNKKDAEIKRRIEPAMHIIAFVWAFGTAFSSAVRGYLNNANLWCWIAPYPSDCLDSWRYGDLRPCERGDSAWIYRWAFYFAPLWFCILFATICTFLVYGFVKKHDLSTLRYRRPEERLNFMGQALSQPQGLSIFSRRSRASLDESVRSVRFEIEGSPVEVATNENLPSNAVAGDMPQRQLSSVVLEKVKRWRERRESFATDNPRTFEVFYQALWYLGTFYITHCWSTSNRIVQQMNEGETKFPLIFIHSWFDPFQVSMMRRRAIYAVLPFFFAPF